MPRNKNGRRGIRPLIFTRKHGDTFRITDKMELMNISSGSSASSSGPARPSSPAQSDTSGEIWLTFQDMNLSEKLLRGIFKYGLKKPATIQQKAIVPCIRGKDLVMQAQSGMGKTAALCIGILQRINLENKESCQALVLAPTRELALQITEVFRELSKFMGIRCMSCTGGTNLKKDKEKLTGGGVSIVIGTLGRVLHLVKDGFFLTDEVRMFAIDEADKMLTDGAIKKHMRELIGEHIPDDAQVILMSATMPQEALDRANELLRNPEYFIVNNYELTLEGIKQYHVNIGDQDEERKLQTLLDLKAIIAEEHTVIFCNTRKRVAWLTKKLLEQGGSAFTSTSADKDQDERNMALQNFRNGDTTLMVTSDLLSRGIDVKQVSLVINYDIPKIVEEYIHRVGRGGRYGRKGIALTFIVEEESDHLNKIEQFYNTLIPPMPCNMFK